jgi:serine/threonine protein phosphatase PrpC
VKLSIYGMTDTGRHRTGNEDCILVAPELSLAAVCDGMGGHEAGEVASRTAVDSIFQWFSQGGDDGGYYQLDMTAPAMARRLASGLLHADQAIRAAARAVPGRTGMGTTAVVAVVDGGRAFIAHAGDSRCYICRGRSLQQVTEDHSVVQDLLRAGIITPAQSVHVKKNAITRALGVTDNLVVDVDGVELMPGDTLLLCSDGLHGMVSDQDLGKVMGSSRPLNELCRTMVDMANAAGGTDNISAVLMRAEI